MKKANNKKLHTFLSFSRFSFFSFFLSFQFQPENHIRQQYISEVYREKRRKKDLNFKPQAQRKDNRLTHTHG